MNYAGEFKFSHFGGDAPLGAAVGVEAKNDALSHADGHTVIVPDAHLLFSGDYKRAGVDLVLSKDGHDYVVSDYFKGHSRATLSSPNGANLSGDLVNALTGEVQLAQLGGGATAAATVIGRVTKLTGNATAIRNGVSIQLNMGDNVQKGDVVQAGADSSLGLTFIDGTVFGLSANARMVLNEMVYDPNGSSNSSLLSLVQGTITFVAGETAKHGDMKVDTPVATMGIRGTAVLVEIGFEVPGQGGAPPVKFQVLVEPGGRAGSYVLYSKTGSILGTVNQAGQVTSVLGNGDTSTGHAPPLTDVAKDIINKVFEQYFPGYVPNANPQSGGPIGGSTPQNPNTGTSPDPLKFYQPPDPPPGVPTPVPIKYQDDSGTHTIDVTLTRFNSAPTIVVTPVVVTLPVNKTSFDIADQPIITDPDAGDVIIPYVPGSAHLISATGPANGPSSAALAQLITIDPPTGHVTYDPAAFKFLPTGTAAVYTIGFDVQSGPDTAHETLTFTVDGANDAPVVAAALTVPVHEGDSAIITNLLAGASDPDAGETATLSVANVRYAIDGHVASTTAPAGLTLTGAVLSVDPANAAFHHLAQGETTTIVVSYDVTDVHGAVVHQTETVTITGTYDAPIVTGAVTGTATEDGVASTLDALANTVIIDDGATLSITGVPAQLPPGVIYDAASHTFTLYPAIAAYQHLGVSQTTTVSVNYGVFDGTTTTNTSASWTITGSYDAPVITGSAVGDATEDGAVSTIGAFANTITIDDGTTLSVIGVPAQLPAGVSYDDATHTFSLDPTNAAYQHLAEGAKTTVSVNYQVSDGTTAANATATWTITGINDAPVAHNDVIAFNAPAGTGWTLDSANGHYYRYVGSTVSWNAAASAATQDGAYLATITSAAEQAFVYNLTNGVGGWAGGYGPNAADASTWIWAQGPESGSLLAPLYTNWLHYPDSGQEPNGGFGETDAALHLEANGGWNDVPTDWLQHGYIEEWGGRPSDNPLEDAPFTIASLLLANDSDADDEHVLSIMAASATSAHGAAVSLLNGVITYNPTGAAAVEALAAGQTLTDTFTYTVTDEHGATSTATVTLTVTGTNDAPVIDLNGVAAGVNATVAIAPDNAPHNIFTNVSISDVDSGATIDNVTLTWSALGTSLLALGTLAGITITHITNGLVLSGATDAAAYQTFLSQITLQSQSPDTPTFSVVVNDGFANGAPASVSVVPPTNWDFWTGRHSSNWNDPLNWSLGTPPTPTEIAYVDTLTAINLNLTDDLSIAGLYVTSRTTIDVSNTGIAHVLNVTGTLTNSGDVVLGPNTTLELNGVVQNQGTILVDTWTTSGATLLIDGTVTLEGGGTVILDGIADKITGTADAKLVNVDNTIDGYGTLGDGHLDIVNKCGGTIVADTAYKLVIDVHFADFVNYGLIESSAAGGLEIRGDLENHGTLDAEHGVLDIDGDLTGQGVAKIDGGTLEFGGCSDANVQFSGSSSDELILDRGSHFTGTVSGLATSDSIDLAGISSWNVNIEKHGNVLEVHYGWGANDYFTITDTSALEHLTVSSDHHGGTEIVWTNEAPEIDTSSAHLANGNGSYTISDLSVTDADSVRTEIYGLNLVAQSGSVSLSHATGTLSTIDGDLDQGFTYTPSSQATATSTGKIAITVTDSFGATDTVNFIFSTSNASTSTPLTLTGTDGKDVIFATGHQDTLTGGKGADQFVFADHSGADKITDFKPGQDKIELDFPAPFTLGNDHAFQEWLEHSATQTGFHGQDTLIRLDGPHGSDTLLLQNVSVSSLHASDFIVHPVTHGS
ncbi:MAG: hypothetical protein JWP84_2515 [Tardiphaga sp.]|nr:hypothetical protein [Tardiphaga sp.]